MLRRSFLIFILISTFAVMGCKITGKITNEKGVGVEGITIELSGDASMSTSTDADGIFVFRGLRLGTYKVTPADEEFTFDPPEKDVKISKKKKIGRADFKAAKSQQPPEPPELPQWSTYQGNAAHTGYVPGILNPDDFSFGWERELIESVPLNPVAAGNGKVFVTSGGDYPPHVALALDSAEGTTLWAYEFSDIDSINDSINPPAYANGRVYIQSGGFEHSFLWALDAESGRPLFEQPAPYDNQFFRYYAPTICDDKIYVGGGYFVEDNGTRYHGGAYGFDGFSGTELWPAVDFTLLQSGQWTPAVDETRVIAYNGVFEGQLTIIDRLTGVEKSIPDPDFGYTGDNMNLAPVLGSQNNVIVIHDGRLINFDLEDPDNPDNPLQIQGGFSGQPSLAQGIIFAVYEGELRALNESDGSFIEDWKLGQPLDGSIDYPMIVTDNLIFVSTASTTYAIDLEKQEEEWSYAAGGHLAISDDGILFIATTDGRLIAINLY